MQQSDPLDELIDDLVDEADACRIIGGRNTPIHRSTLWRGINAGRYPKPLKIGPNSNRWRSGELYADLQKAAAARHESTE
ncbi:AlpA family phage regulatory protein [Mesorhizobium sp. M0088]|uniref:helix-turn-helix transcriptional regulator n=1 Tax=Mesorhizobium sp. M0088 TaxID=2956873 RepID=UPI00333C98C3